MRYRVNSFERATSRANALSNRGCDSVDKFRGDTSKDAPEIEIPTLNSAPGRLTQMCLNSEAVCGSFRIVDSPQSKQADWFVAEVESHERSLRAYVHYSFPAVRDVDDVVQVSFLKLWQKRAAEPIRSAKAFLFTVARNVALDVIRHNRRSPIEAVGDLAALNVLEDKPTASALASRAERVQLLIDAIDSLPSRCREVVILRKLKFVPQREVAARLGISEKGVEIQLTRGLGRCRDYLARHGVDSFFGDES